MNHEHMRVTGQSHMAFLETEWTVNEIAALPCPAVQVNPS
jgi:hypothetical protein